MGAEATAPPTPPPSVGLGTYGRAAMRDAGEKMPVWFYMAPGDR